MESDPFSCLHACRSFEELRFRGMEPNEAAAMAIRIGAGAGELPGTPRRRCACVVYALALLMHVLLMHAATMPACMPATHTNIFQCCHGTATLPPTLRGLITSHEAAQPKDGSRNAIPHAVQQLRQQVRTLRN